MFAGILKAYEDKVSDSRNILMYGSKWLSIAENAGVVKQQRKLLIVKKHFLPEVEVTSKQVKQRGAN